jgi:hypothetical protein
MIPLVHLHYPYEVRKIKCINSFILNTINILLIREYHFKIQWRENFILCMLTPLQIALPSAVHLAQRQFLFEGTDNEHRKASDISKGYNSKAESYQKCEAEFRTKGNFNHKQYMRAILSLT